MNTAEEITKVKLTTKGKQLNQQINGPKTRRDYSKLKSILGYGEWSGLPTQSRIDARVLIGKASREEEVPESKMLTKFIKKGLIEVIP